MNCNVNVEPGVQKRVSSTSESSPAAERIKISLLPPREREKELE